MFSITSRAGLFIRQTSGGNRKFDEGTKGMATLKAISNQLKSVKNIKKITQSMKMVSAAKFTRAERELRQAKPLGDGAKIFYKKLESEEEEQQQQQQQQPTDAKKKVLYLAMTSDRGLCGAVHTSVVKSIRNEFKSDEAGENVKIVCVGDKSRTLLQRLFGGNILFACNEIGRLPPTFMDASVVTSEILNSEFEFEIAKVVYNRFRTVVSYVTEQISMPNIDAIAESPKLNIFDELDEETLLSFLEFTMVATIYSAMKEAACSEQSSRMTAMDNASKNAGDMIGKLTLSFNRTRQAVITRELIEIISGASAL